MTGLAISCRHPVLQFDNIVHRPELIFRMSFGFFIAPDAVNPCFLSCDIFVDAGRAIRMSGCRRFG